MRGDGNPSVSGAAADSPTSLPPAAASLPPGRVCPLHKGAAERGNSEAEAQSHEERA